LVGLDLGSTNVLKWHLILANNVPEIEWLVLLDQLHHPLLLGQQTFEIDLEIRGVRALPKGGCWSFSLRLVNELFKLFVNLALVKLLPESFWVLDCLADCVLLQLLVNKKLLLPGIR